MTDHAGLPSTMNPKEGSWAASSLRRLLLTIPVLLGASFLIFAMVYALPGDPIRALAGDRPLAPAVVAS